MHTKTTLTVAAALLAIAAAWLACAGASSEHVASGLQTPRALPVTTIAAKATSSYTVRRSYTGQIAAARASELSFLRQGRVTRVLVDVGDVVPAGAVVAKLDTRRLLAKHEELLAQRRRAAALLADLDAGPRDEQIAAAEAEVKSLKAQLDLATANHRRNERLGPTGAVSTADVERTGFGRQAASARLEAARKRLEELLAGARPEQIDAQRAAVAQLDAAIAQLEIELEDSVLTAPFAGVVSHRHLDEGAVVSPGMPVARLVETTSEAWIGLPLSLSWRLEAGQRHTLDCEGREYPATVKAVLPELDTATRTCTVVFQLDEPDARLAPGQIVRIALDREMPLDGEAFWLPVSALARGPRGLWDCFVVAPTPGGGHKVERRSVEVLHTDGGRAVIRGTLAPGEAVVAEGVHRLVEGQSVAPAKS